MKRLKSIFLTVLVLNSALFVRPSAISGNVGEDASSNSRGSGNSELFKLKELVSDLNKACFESYFDTEKFRELFRAANNLNFIEYNGTSPLACVALSGKVGDLRWALELEDLKVSEKDKNNLLDMLHGTQRKKRTYKSIETLLANDQQKRFCYNKTEKSERVARMGKSSYTASRAGNLSAIQAEVLKGCRMGTAASFKEVLGRIAHLNFVNVRGNSPLAVAAGNLKLVQVRLLLESDKLIGSKEDREGLLDFLNSKAQKNNITAQSKRYLKSIQIALLNDKQKRFRYTTTAEDKRLKSDTDSQEALQLARKGKAAKFENAIKKLNASGANLAELKNKRGKTLLDVIIANTGVEKFKILLESVGYGHFGSRESILSRILQFKEKTKDKDAKKSLESMIKVLSDCVRTANIAEAGGASGAETEDEFDAASVGTTNAVVGRLLFNDPEGASGAETEDELDIAPSGASNVEPKLLFGLSRKKKKKKKKNPFSERKEEKKKKKKKKPCKPTYIESEPADDENEILSFPNEDSLEEALKKHELLRMKNMKIASVEND